MTDPTTPTGEPETIHVLMGRVLRDLPAIGKNQRNEEQRFMFRGYDDVMNALNPILSTHGVFFMPKVRERISGTRATRSGATMYEVNLHVEFTFYGPAGDSVVADGWGEGTDMGDKATNKAMTNALKYVLFQTFAISTEEAHRTDTDHTSPEETIPDQLECRGCGAMIAGARTDREPMRAHVVEVHGWHRLEDGSVVRPEAWERMLAERAAEDAARGEESQDSEVPATPPTTAAEPAPAPDTPAPPPPAASDAAGGQDDAVPDVSPDTPAEPEPEPEPVPVTDAEPEADGGQDDEGFQCPDCTAPPFPTMDEYSDHWYAEHDPEAVPGEPTGEPESDGTSDDPAELVGKVKMAVSGLTGPNARAYSKYRREQKLPRPDEMDADQARTLLAFLESLGAV